MVDELISKDIKKSQFIAKESGDLLDADTFDFVSDGQNFKIALSELIQKFGTTGSLIAKGEVTGVPVLNINGTVNEIRNIVGGSGIVPSLSPQDGILLDHGFLAGSSGSPVLTDITADNPIIRNLVPGTGLSIAEDGDNLIITVTAIPAASNIVVVNSMSDFPAPVAGVITLADSTGYLVSGDLTTSDRFVMGLNTLLFGSDSLVSSITYTGTGTMITSSSLNAKLYQILLSCPNGKLFDISSTGAGTFQIIGVVCPICDEVGDVTDIAAMQMVSNSFQNIVTDGILFSGAMGVFAFARNRFQLAAGSGCVLDFGTAVFSDGFSCETSSVQLGAGTCFMDGLVDSGNMGSGALGVLFNTRFSGTGTPLNNIAITDARWQFFANDDIGDTRADGLLNLQANATATVITVATTPVLVAGTWVVEEVSQFTGTAAGRLTYKGPKVAKLPVTLSLTGAPVSGTNKTITYHLYLNGVAISGATQDNIISSGSPKNTTLIWQLDMDTDDYLEIFVSNDTDTIDVLVATAIFRVN